jgi:hypothetical protein
MARILNKAGESIADPAHRQKVGISESQIKEIGPQLIRIAKKGSLSHICNVNIQFLKVEQLMKIQNKSFKFTLDN